ncbi:ABC transporter ATP-binding protein [Streptomyces sp. PAN_FS17]|uniref:ABC transporter ATP-binding protein n=1 Tax=Streptomyces sp. PAN_FS17 TaxID=1855351 RepID=UPI00115FFC53|nr:ABC transporter ATP-binding protein [Streptomyces sp. PAN_FS17]
MKGGDDSEPSKIRPGTSRRVLAFVRPHRKIAIALILVTLVDSLVIVTTPLLLKEIVDGGIMKDDARLVVVLALFVAALALAGSVTQLAQSALSGRIGQGVSHDLRVQAFRHVQRMPLAFFTRTQTGALSSRLSTDVVMAQQALTTLLLSATGAVTVVLVLAEMFYLSWLVSLIALVLLPLFFFPWLYIGRRLQAHSRKQMELHANLSGTIHERFNVQGAMLAKLFGRPAEELADYQGEAERVREVGVRLTIFSRLAFILMALLTALTTALVYGVGGGLVLDGVIGLGTLVALATLLGRLFGPITQLSSMQANALTVLVSFDRIFELLDIKPLIEERPDAVALPAPSSASAPEIRFDQVSFAYPRPEEVSLASLEAHSTTGDQRSKSVPEVLHGLDFSVAPGTLTALVGPSGAGKTTITHLVSRLYDVTSGAVRIDGKDVRDLTFDSLRATVGVVAQDAYLFHDTIRANLAYARPEATEEELIEACEQARILDLIRSLPDGLDTVVGDRGFRLSGGEKQRLAVARLLLKAPAIVVLDEATAHLDSESEAAVQRALKTALSNRTSLVIAHRLSTIREADQILVIDDGRVREQGTHDELLAAGGLYTHLHNTQFSKSETLPPPRSNGQHEQSPPQGPTGPRIRTRGGAMGGGMGPGGGMGGGMPGGGMPGGGMPGGGMPGGAMGGGGMGGGGMGGPGMSDGPGMRGPRVRGDGSP